MAASEALSKAAAAKRGFLMFNNLRPCSSSFLNTKVTGVPTLNFSNPVAPPVRIVPEREQEEEEGVFNNFKSSLLFLDKAPGVVHSDLTRLNVRGRYDETESADDDYEDGDFSDGSDEDFSDSDLDDECKVYEDDSDEVEEEKEEEEKARPRRGGK